LAENHEVSKASDSVQAISNMVKEEESAIHADVPAHEASHNAVDHNSSAHDTPHNMASIGLIEIFMFLGFIGLFLFSVLSSLSKDRLVPLKSPFLDESLNYKW
jgi:zinc transporter ZupT